ncbi:MAG: STAS domain-containing protein [Halomonas subglaciescola]|nr:STAS domain-containing protein [Halomonas subglaciescola]
MTALFSRQGIALTAQDDNTLEVSGNLGEGTAAALAGAGERWLENVAAPAALTLDFRGVDRASSAAISVLLQWLRACRTRHIRVEDILLSEPLSRLARLAELDTLFDNPIDNLG